MGEEMVIAECLRDNENHDVPRNVVSLQKIQEDRHIRSIEIGNVYGSDDICDLSW